MEITMKEFFTGPGLNKDFTFTDTGIEVSGKIIKYEEIDSLKIVSPPSLLMIGLIDCIPHGGKTVSLAYGYRDRERMASVIAKANDIIDMKHGVEKNYLYKLQAHTGTSLEVYEEYIIINFVESGAYFANALKGGGNGGKRIDIDNITSIQFKEPAGVTIGFIQFEYPGSIGDKAGLGASINDENSIPVSTQNLELARQIVDFIEKQRKTLKNQHSATRMVVSTADEIMKFKKLLDAGIITQEEFEAKKKQLLDL